MQQPQDLMSLYSSQILALAAALPLTSPLREADGAAYKRAPLCGSHVRIEIALDGQKVTGYHHDIKACALGQASASILSKSVIGADVPKLERAYSALCDLLMDMDVSPPKEFSELSVLRAASGFRNRHASIRLAFEATLEAIATAQKKPAN